MNTGLVQFVFSRRLEEREHTDVTTAPLSYAAPKTFAFPSKSQLRQMDENRHYRQRMRDTQMISVGDITSPACSIDALARQSVIHEERLRASPPERIAAGIVQATHRLRLSSKVTR